MSNEVRKLTRREMLKAMGLGAAGVALAACAPPPTPEKVVERVVETVEVPKEVVVTATPPPAKPVTLRAGLWDSVEVEPMETQILEAFKAEFPHVTVKMEFNPDAYDDKILTSLAGRNAPDVFLWWNFPQLVARGGLEDLTPYMEGPRGLDASIYYKEILDYNRVGPGLYGLPKDFTPRAFFYNKKLFDEAGLPYPTNDWTWNDLLDMAIKLTKGEGVEAQYGFYTYTGVYPLQCYVWSNGGDFISPDGKKASGYCDSEATIQALDWYVKLRTEYGVSPTAESEQTLGGASEMFINDRLAIYDTGRWPQSSFKAVEGLDFGTVLPPKSPNTNQLVTVLHEAGWCMNPASPYKFNEAWELLKALAGPLAHKIRTEAGWAIPAIPSVVEELGLLDDPIEKTWFEAVPFATVSPCFTRTIVWSVADAEFVPAIEAAFLGEATAEEAMKKVAPIVDDILATV